MRPTTIKKEKRSYSLKYYYKNAVKLRDRALKYYHNNKEKCNRRHMVWRNKLRDEIIIKFGNKCKRCGFNDKRALQIDHVNGGGCKETNGLSPATFYKKVLANKNGKYQLLCANCNSIKKFENNELGKKLYF